MSKYDHLTREELIALLEKNEQNETIKLQDRLDGERRIAEALVLMLKNYNGNYEEDIMRIVLERYKADRAFIFKFNWDTNTNDNLYEVNSENIPAEIHHLQNLPNNALSDYLEQFHQGIPLIVNAVEQLPKTTYQGHNNIEKVFQLLNLKSAILFPMHIFGELWGYIGIETVRNYRTWTENDIEWLKSFTNILSIGVSQRFMRTQAIHSEHRFSALFQNMPIGYVRHRIICDTHNQPVDYEYLEVNPAFEKLTGLSAQQCIGKTATEIIGKVNPQLLQVYQQVAFEGKQKEFDYFTPSLGRYFYSVIYSPQQEEFIALFYDITERIKATEQIRQNEKKVRTIFENLPVCIVTFDHQGDFTNYNEYASHIFKKLQKSDTNRKLNLTPEQIEKLHSQKTLSFDFTFDVEHQKILTIKNNIIPPNAIFLSSKLIMYTDEQNTCLGYIFIAIDNTDIKRTNLELTKTQKALTENLVRQSLILETGQIYPWYMNIETKELDISEDFYKAFGQQKEDYTNFTPDDFIRSIHPDDFKKFRQAFRELENGQRKKIKIELRINIFNQGYIWCEMSAAVRSRGKNSIITKWLGFLTIIQKRKDNEKQLIEAIKKAEESDKLKSAFLANVSHEIRTPLNAIVGFSELLANSVDEEEKKYYLDIVKTNNNLLLNLINDILDLSKIESGRMDIKESQVNVKEVCQEICHVHQLKAHPGVKIIFDSANTPLTMLTDPNRLIQLYSNLINNAVKNTFSGTITAGYHLLNDTVECFVRDTGKGIPKNKQALIFNRFEKLDSNVQGFGLGLSICKSILDKMNGSIRVISEEGKGTEFTFTLPYRPASILEQIEKQTSKSSILVQSIPTNFTILIAEDIDFNYELLQAILKSRCKIIRAHNGIEAIDLFTSENPDIILMDLKMPDLDGLEATRIIRKISPSIPIIALTAFAYDSDKEEAIKAGCNDFLTKPVEAIKLKAIIQEYISSNSKNININQI